MERRGILTMLVFMAAGWPAPLLGQPEGGGLESVVRFFHPELGRMEKRLEEIEKELENAKGSNAKYKDFSIGCRNGAR